MRYLALSLVFLAISCTSTPTSSPSMNPLQAAGCDVETAVTQSFGAVVLAQCGGVEATPGACGNAFLTALGNVNVCGQTSASGVSAASIKMAQINAAKAAIVKPQGIIAPIVCPIAYSAVEGLLTGIIPTACGCTKSFDAGAAGAGLVAACSALPF